MKPKWIFVKTWGRASHSGSANHLSITWGWLPSSRNYKTTTHFGIELKINNIAYGFGIYRCIPWETTNEVSSSNY